MNRQLKMVFSRSIQPPQIPAQTSAQINSTNKSVQPTPYTRSMRSAHFNPTNKSMFDIGNKSCGCGS
jgi:hypothetical protein